MSKRTTSEDIHKEAAPGDFSLRRKARISPRFRKPDKVTATAAPSAFASMAAPKPGFVFGSGAVASPPASSFSVQSGTSTAPAAIGSLSSRGNPPAPTRAAVPVAPEKQLAPPRPTSVGTQPARDTSSSTKVNTTGWQARAFGKGKAAAQGGRLNKRFLSWISQQLANDASSILDSGLRDYVAFAAEIRERADLAIAEPAPIMAFRHPPMRDTSSGESNGSDASVTPSSATSQATTAETLPVVAAPAPAPALAPAPAIKSAPIFSFSAPSSLPPTASSGPSFSSTLPTVGPKATAPPASSPLKGFSFNSKGLGAAGAPPAAFNGFQLPSMVAIPPLVGGDEAAEEDGMPKAEPSKLERAPGEENEEVVGQFRAKLFRFKLDEKAWGDMGVGMLRLMKHTVNDRRRMVLRNDMGKVILNAALYEGMEVTKAKNTIKFVASIAGDGPTTFMVKVTAKEIDDFHTRVVGLVPLP